MKSQYILLLLLFHIPENEADTVCCSRLSMYFTTYTSNAINTDIFIPTYTTILSLVNVYNIARENKIIFWTQNHNSHMCTELMLTIARLHQTISGLLPPNVSTNSTKDTHTVKSQYTGPSTHKLADIIKLLPSTQKQCTSEHGQHFKGTDCLHLQGCKVG